MKTWQKATFIIVLVAFVTVSVVISFYSMARAPFEYEYRTDIGIRVKDYQMYLSGERFEAYQGVVGWFTTPITTLVSLIIPLMFYRVGFTSDWDVLYMSDIRIKCMLIGIGFDLAGYILVTIPYLLFWDYTDEKHEHVMEVLKLRAQEIVVDEDPSELSKIVSAPRKSKKNKRTQSKT